MQALFAALQQISVSGLDGRSSRRVRSRQPPVRVEVPERLLLLPELVAKNIRVVANAGGVNPQACMKAVLAAIEKQGVKGVKVGIVEGDDILGQLDELMASGEKLSNMDTGAPLSSGARRPD